MTEWRLNMDINEYFYQFYPTHEGWWDEFEFTTMLGGMERYTGSSPSPIFPRIICADGFSMSVQGHYGAYSYPRDDFAEGYSEVEVGFPSALEELLMPYAELPETPTETVYGFVPVELVETVIEKHGGLVSGSEARS